MKTGRSARRLATAICLLAVCIPAALAFADSSIVTPKRCELVESRVSFPFRVIVDGMDRKARYWTAMANVQTDNSVWPETLRLYEKLRRNPRDQNARKALEEAAKAWKPIKFWPKFAVTDSPMTSDMHDGGRNALKGIEPQPMIILVMKVDENLNKRIIQWFHNGPKAGWPGFSADDFAPQYEIVVRTEIFLP